VIVANARELKWITSSDTKNDRNDAMKLARLARADRSLLAPVEHRSAEQQAEQAVIRARDALVKSRSLLVNTARSLAKGFGLRLPTSITHTFGARPSTHLRRKYSNWLAAVHDSDHYSLRGIHLWLLTGPKIQPMTNGRFFATYQRRRNSFAWLIWINKFTISARESVRSG
jgi:transposase